MALQSAQQCDAPVTRMRSMRCYEAMYTPCAWPMTTRGIYGFSSFKSASGRFTNKCCKIRYPTKPSAWRDVLVRENNQSAGPGSDVERDGIVLADTRRFNHTAQAFDGVFRECAHELDPSDVDHSSSPLRLSYSKRDNESCYKPERRNLETFPRVATNYTIRFLTCKEVYPLFLLYKNNNRG